MTCAAALLRRLRAVRSEPGRSDPAARLVLRAAGLDEYRGLSRFHYRAGDPGPGSRVWSLRDPREGGQVVAVLVVSRPTLNGSWRDVAWPGRFRRGDRGGDARRINRELRVISRVIVDPRWRGLGVAARLVRGYLRRPLTVRTEAVAAMGAVCPFFERAGMRRVGVPSAARTRRLLRVLGELRVEPWRLACPEALPARVRNSRELRRALRVWARASRATRRLAGARVDRLMLEAAGRLVPLCAYVAERRGRAKGGEP